MIDNSNILADQSQFKFRLGEVIENSVNLLEKSTFSIFRELNRMREEYSGVINKCNKFI